jgi:hypothetical protein
VKVGDGGDGDGEAPGSDCSYFSMAVARRVTIHNTLGLHEMQQ